MADPLASIVAQNAVSTATATASVATGGQTISQGQFLQLFIAQLQNQDPLSPMDPDQMTAQLAQFASLEQLTGVNTRLDQLTGVSRNSVLGLIGKDIQFTGGQLSVASGQASAVHYTLGDNAGAVTATVRGPDGTPVRVMQLGAQAAGDHVFQFDGHDGSGTAVPDGTYTVDISATGTDQTTQVTVNLASEGTVDGVDFSANPPVVLVGGLRIPLDQISQVHQVGTPTGQGSS